MDYNDAAPQNTMSITANDPHHGYDAGTSTLSRFTSIEDVIKTLRPAQPVECMHPENLARAAATFLEHFNGHSLYAVKANPDPYVLTHLYAAGIRHFDVASLGEIQLVRGLFPTAHLAFMNPVKSRESIHAAYFEYGVRDFVIDTADELHKILDETKTADDLTIVVRLGMPKGSAACQLSGKFGCLPETAVELLREIDHLGLKTGLSFHVGSQTLDPQSYALAIQKAGNVLTQSGVSPAVFDVGGGFPVPHLGMDILPLTDYFDVIHKAIAEISLPASCQLWSEPGRALSGTASTLIVRVELRKNDVLYINDGSYGNMFEVCSMNWKNTVQMIRLSRRNRKAVSKQVMPFRFYGPTCDSVDYMPGPFLLPDDANEGDWIAIQGMGAYGSASQSHFNGFHSEQQVEVSSRTTARKGHLKLVKSDRRRA